LKLTVLNIPGTQGQARLLTVLEEKRYAKENIFKFIIKLFNIINISKVLYIVLKDVVAWIIFRRLVGPSAKAIITLDWTRCFKIY
jgi:hypothetical protein